MATAASLPAPSATDSLTRHAVAILAVAVALLIRGTLSGVLGESVPYVILFPAVAFNAWYCGVGPSALSVVLALAGARYWFISPIHSFALPATTAHLLGMVAFLLASGFVIALGEYRRRENVRLRESQAALEDRVKERTQELANANQNLRELTARLLQLQDEERRRFARELHDSVGQSLAALNMNLATVRTDLERLSKTVNAVSESETLVQQMSKEVRTISHLLHPPLLDEAGLVSALRWYVEGFAERSKIEVELEFPQNFQRLSQELETAVFRVVQECLTNIHRHSESRIAKIRIGTDDSFVLVEVEDRGKGISPEKMAQMDSKGMPGVGIRGMRERIRQLGGVLEIDSSRHGTTMRVRLPTTSVSSTAIA
jgi:signal transduction histidine kinase